MQDPILRPTYSTEGRSETDKVSDGDVKEIDIAEILALEYQGADFATLRKVFKTIIGEMDAYPEKRRTRRRNYFNDQDVQYFTRIEVNAILNDYKDKIYKRLRNSGVSWEISSYATSINPTVPSHTSAESLSKALSQYPVRLQRVVDVLAYNGTMLESEAALAISIHRMYEKVLSSIHFNGRFFVADSERISKLTVEVPNRKKKKQDWNKWGDSIFAEE